MMSQRDVVPGMDQKHHEGEKEPRLIRDRPPSSRPPRIEVSSVEDVYLMVVQSVGRDYCH